MREIKFRCWYDNRMYKVVDIDFAYERINLRGADIIGFEDGKLMQYIGLLDKNGKRIYEGDIISNGYEKCIVVWVKEYSGFMLKLINKEYEDKEWTNPMIDLRKDEEVIGNIYDNPELLEKGKE